MKKIIECLKKYVDDEVSMKNWNDEAKQMFSLALVSSYNFYLLNLIQTDFILIEPLETLTVEKLEKNIRFIESKTNCPCVLALKRISTYMVKKFVKDKIAFVVEDNQLSIPYLALKIRTVLQGQKRIENIERFTPFCQLVYLFLLYSENNEFSINEISGKLNISVMSILRAMNSLENLGLVTSEIGGETNRKKLFRKIEQNKFFELGKKYLDNPVKRILYVSKIPEDLKAFKGDLTALSKKTMLGEPNRKTYAIYKNEEQIMDFLISDGIDDESNSIIIQSMKYDVSLLTNDDCVDPITLISGLKEKDDRVEMAIEELMEGYEWFTE